MQGKTKGTSATTVIFCLTRGYPFLEKFRYAKLIIRNIHIKKALKNHSNEVDRLIFHEGNISEVDKVLIRLFSFDFALKFVLVNDFFEVCNEQVENIDENLWGYTMMCRFHYAKVWKYLSHYNILIRIDDDCFVYEIPELPDDKIFLCSGISEETHDRTNESLLSFLRSFQSGQYYDHKFPYTNFYITSSSFWLQEEVQIFLNGFLNHPRSKVDRWGDLPIIGITLKKYADWNFAENLIEGFSYKHYSHRSEVVDGVISYGTDSAGKIIIQLILDLFKKRIA